MCIVLSYYSKCTTLISLRIRLSIYIYIICIYIYIYICHHHLGPTLLGPCVLAIVPRNLSADPKNGINRWRFVYSYIFYVGDLSKIAALASFRPQESLQDFEHYWFEPLLFKGPLLPDWLISHWIGHQTVGCGQRWYLDSWLVFFEGFFADSMDMLNDITFQRGLSKVDIGRWWLL